jgi:hypothetical protein
MHDLHAIFRDQPPDDFPLMPLVLNLPQHGERLFVDLGRQYFSALPQKPFDGGVRRKMKPIVIPRKSFQHFRARPLMCHKMRIHPALSQIFEAEPGKARLASKFVGSVLADNANSRRRAVHRFNPQISRTGKVFQMRFLALREKRTGAKFIAPVRRLT